MKDFVYIGRPARVVFGAGTLRQLPAELDRLGARKALVLSTPEQRASAEQVAALLGARVAGIFDRAVMHVPIETAREAREMAAQPRRRLRGGHRRRLDHRPGQGDRAGLRLADPRDSDHLCRLGDDADLRPHRGRPEEDRPRRRACCRAPCIYDPELTLGAAGGHERHQRHQRDRACGRRPLLDDDQPDHRPDGARRASRAGRAHCRASSRPGDCEARGDALYGAWLCGTVLGRRRHGAAPQAVPHAGRQLQPAARGDAHRRAAARARLQRAPRRREAMQRIAAALGGRRCAAGGVRPGARTTARRWR